MSYTRGNYSNDMRGGNGAGGNSTNDEVTLLIVTDDSSLDVMATITTFMTRNGRRSSVSFLRRKGSVNGHDRWTQVSYLRQIQPSDAIAKAEQGLHQLANGGAVENEL